MRMLEPPPPTPSTIPRIGLTTIPWVTDFLWRGAGHTGEAPYCEAKNDERKWCQKEDRSHGLVSTANTARQGRRKKNNAAKLSRLF